MHAYTGPAVMNSQVDVIMLANCFIIWKVSSVFECMHVNLLCVGTVFNI